MSRSTELHALNIASLSKKDDILKLALYLKEHNVDKDGYHMLYTALCALKDNLDGVKSLLDLGINVNVVAPRRDHSKAQKYRFGESLLLSVYRATESKSLFGLMLEYGADVNIQDNFGHTSIHHCVLHYRGDIFNLFMDHGSNLNVQDNIGNTVAHYLALLRQDPRLMNIFFERGSDLSIKNKRGYTVHDIMAFGRLKNMWEQFMIISQTATSYKTTK